MILERIKQYIDYKGISVAALEKSIGMSNASFGKSLKKGGAIGTDKLEHILTAYPDLNIIWLTTGQGKMINEGQDNHHRDTSGIPLIPFDNMSGYFARNSTIMSHEYKHFFVPNFRNADFLITVRGDSMAPRYYAGDLIACKILRLSDLFFQWGKVYIFDTEQGTLIKRVEQSNIPDTIKVTSENPAYGPFELPLTCVNHVALVLGLIRNE